MKKLFLTINLLITSLAIFGQQWNSTGDNYTTGKLNVDGIVNTNNGRLVLRDNSIEEWKTNGNSQIAINYYGYNNGLTQYRDFAIYNGKAARIMFIDGSNGYVGIGTTPTVKLDIAGNVKTNNGRLVLRDNSLEDWKTNGISEIAINYYGFNKGNTQFRNFSVYNGKTGRLMFINGSNGSVGIGTSATGSYKLAVEGKIGAHEIVVTTDGWSDFVFNKDYKLKELEEVESFIEENNHLPDIPSEKEVLENGIQVGEMNAKLLQKIEELTLYTIQQEKRIKKLEKENKEIKLLNAKLIELQSRLEKAGI